MKKRNITALFTAALLLTGCSGNKATEQSSVPTTSAVTSDTTPGTTAAPELPTEEEISDTEESYQPKSDGTLKKMKNQLTEKISDSVPADIIEVKNGEKGIYVSVSVDGIDNISKFGNYILDIRSAFSEIFDGETVEKLDIILFDGVNIALSYEQEAHKGKLSSVALIDDRRSGESKKTYIFSDDELFEIFPQARQHVSKQGIDDEKIKIYEEVMAELNAQFDRPESEIYEELAPKYGMTAAELEALVREVMEQIYS